MSEPPQNPFAGSSQYPGGSPSPGSNLHPMTSNMTSHPPTQGQQGLKMLPTSLKLAQPGPKCMFTALFLVLANWYCSQNQPSYFPSNANVQQLPNFRQSPHQQPSLYQQTSLPPQHAAQYQTPNFQQQNPNFQHNPIFQQSLSPQQTPPQQTLTPQQATWRRFTVPTNSDSISSGFPFHPQLYSLQVNHDEWHQFTTEIVEGAKLTASEDAAAWAAGSSVGAVSSAFLLVFGPPIGYYTGKAIHKKTVVKKAKERMLENGDLRAVLNKWNQRNFKWKGFQVWLECPTDFVQTTPGAPKHQVKAEKKQAQKFRLVIIPNSEIKEPYSAAPWTQVQPALVEAPSAPPQSPVELQDTPAHNGPIRNDPLKGPYPPALAVAEMPAKSELDTTLHVSQPMPAELSG